MNPPSGLGPQITYGYDGSGNRVSVQKGSQSPVTTQYDSRGLPATSSDATSFTYDGAGNLKKIQKASGAPTQYTYDAWNHMVSASGQNRSGSGTYAQTYAWDGLGRMVSSGPSGNLSTFTYRGNTFERTTSKTGTTTTAIAYGPYGPLGQKITGSSNSARYFLKNPHGDVSGLVRPDTNSAPTTTVNYSPWGEVAASTTGTGAADTLALGFQGQPTDAATGLTVTDTRLYDPSMGRFDTQDILFGDPKDYGSLNQYVYGQDDPVGFSDLSGMGCVYEPESGRYHCPKGVGPGTANTCPAPVGTTSSGTTATSSTTSPEPVVEPELRVLLLNSASQGRMAFGRPQAATDQRNDTQTCISVGPFVHVVSGGPCSGAGGRVNVGYGIAAGYPALMSFNRPPTRSAHHVTAQGPSA